MPNVNSARRFPRAAYLRRIVRIMRELEDWREHYSDVRLDTESPALYRKATERWQVVDDLWHELELVERSLAYMS